MDRKVTRPAPRDANVVCGTSLIGFARVSPPERRLAVHKGTALQ